jgi:nucleoside 2-deoxyribosyltransferase
MSKQRTIYLCGPMEHVSKEDATGWRDVAKQKLGLECNLLDPCRRIHSFKLEQMRTIFEMDLRDIRESDIILADLSNPNVPKNGTAMEVFYAAYVLRIPVVAFKPDPTTIHPFFESLVTRWRSDVDKACETILEDFL